MQCIAISSGTDLKRLACDRAMSRGISNVLPSNMSELKQIRREECSVEWDVVGRTLQLRENSFQF